MKFFLTKLEKSKSAAATCLSLLCQLLQCSYATSRSKSSSIWTVSNRLRFSLGLDLDLDSDKRIVANPPSNTNPYIGIIRSLAGKQVRSISSAKFCSDSGVEKKRSGCSDSVVEKKSSDCYDQLDQNLDQFHIMAESESVDLKTCEKLPEHLSVQAAHIHEIHNVPMKVLIRPFPSVLDEKKVLSLMETIEVCIV